MPKNVKKTQFGALCYRIDNGILHILLITTQRTKKWSIPKGWPITGKTPEQVSQTEAFEEAGIIGEISSECLGVFSYKKNMGNGKSKECAVDVYALKTTRQIDEFPEQGQRQLEWISSDKAANRVAYPELGKIIRSFAENIIATQKAIHPPTG